MPFFLFAYLTWLIALIVLTIVCGVYLGAFQPRGFFGLIVFVRVGDDWLIEEFCIPLLA